MLYVIIDTAIVVGHRIGFSALSYIHFTQSVFVGYISFLPVVLSLVARLKVPTGLI